MYENWEQVISAVESAMTADGRPFDDTTIANAHLLASLGEGRWQAPDKVGAGYWPTLSLSWSLKLAPIEIEVHPDGYEFYQFFDGRSDIREFKSEHATMFSQELARTLDTLISVLAK